MTGAASIAPLFVPADRPERYGKAAASGADAIIIDLEDAVGPETKDAARTALCQSGALPDNVGVYVRVNGCATPWHKDDIAAISRLAITGIILPKSEMIADMDTIERSLPGVAIIALIESARGLANARGIAASRWVNRLAFGSIDFCADLGAAHCSDALLLARSEIVLASRLADLPPPIDGVTISIHDAALVEADARYAQTLGFGGKLCIHPAQVTPVLLGFRPSADDVAWAERVLSAGTENAASVDGIMVDAPVRARALQILRRAR